MKEKQILNPYLPEYEYIPDGKTHIFDGEVNSACLNLRCRNRKAADKKENKR